MPDLLSLALAAAAALFGVVVMQARARAARAELEARLAAADAAAAELRTSVEREREQAELRIAEAQATREQLLEQFKAVSVDALDANGARFLELAKAQLEQERLKAAGDLEKRQQAIGELVQPVTRKLQEVDKRIAEFDVERAKSATALMTQIETLRRSGEELRSGATALTKALRQPQGRGQWGEMQLRRVVEMAGMAEHCRDFSVQAHALTDEDRSLRPDMVVNLPNGRCVVIDAKTPLDAYLDAAEALDDEAAEPHLLRHAEQVRTQVTQLARKDYTAHCNGSLPDMVVLFLPAEHLFAAAVRLRPGLVEEAWRKGVIIASPTTLLTLLHAVAQGWKEERLARNAEQIASLGRELHERVAKLAEHFALVGRRLDSATDAYNKAVGTLETRVLVTTRKFEQLDAAGPQVEVVELAGAQRAARPIAAPELVAELEPRREPRAV